MLQLHYLFNESIVCICAIKKNGVRNRKFFICVNLKTFQITKKKNKQNPALFIALFSDGPHANG